MVGLNETGGRKRGFLVMLLPLQVGFLACNHTAPEHGTVPSLALGALPSPGQATGDAAHLCQEICKGADKQAMPHS